MASIKTRWNFFKPWSKFYFIYCLPTGFPQGDLRTQSISSLESLLVSFHLSCSLAPSPLPCFFYLPLWVFPSQFSWWAWSRLLLPLKAAGVLLSEWLASGKTDDLCCTFTWERNCLLGRHWEESWELRLPSLGKMGRQKQCFLNLVVT